LDPYRTRQHHSSGTRGVSSNRYPSYRLITNGGCWPAGADHFTAAAAAGISAPLHLHRIHNHDAVFSSARVMLAACAAGLHRTK
jgi:hypothetical protein